jgi:hypothetical protein
VNASPTNPGSDPRATPVETVSITRGAVDETVAEEPSFITVREVGDWCRECREYRPEVLNSTTALAISLGALVGFLPAFAATDSKRNGGWWGIFLFGSIIAVAGCILALLAMVVGLPSVQRLLHRKERPTSLERLADRMEGACEKGRLRAAAALRAEEEKTG